MHTYLYVKKHAVTGLLYFGKTDKKDPYKYNGSGKYWKRHLEKHGANHVETLWVSEPFTDKDDLIEFATFFSEEHDIANSDKWANLIVENGIDGWTKNQSRGSLSIEHKDKISSSTKGRVFSSEHKDKIREAKANNPHVFTEEQKLKLRGKKTPQSKKQCPHCSKIGGASGMAKWHFDKCKFRIV